MPYTADNPNVTPTPEELRARIPGWGADLDPKDRPSFPREQSSPGLEAPAQEMPERQEEITRRERSIEHEQLPAVFGTTCPPKGASGVIRRFAYDRFSEAKATHWLLLMAADRIDVIEHRLAESELGNRAKAFLDRGASSRA